VLKIHRQTILKAVEPEEPTAPDDAESTDAEAAVLDAPAATEPEFGERTDVSATEAARKPAKKTRE
jgi:hypothetical protein